MSQAAWGRSISWGGLFAAAAAAQTYPFFSVTSLQKSRRALWAQTHFPQINYWFFRLTYQTEPWLWADSWTLAASPGTWNPNQDLPLKQEADSYSLCFSFWFFVYCFHSRAGLWKWSHRSFTVNWTPVFSTRGLCGWVGMQGCLSTTRELLSHAHTQAGRVITTKEELTHARTCFFLTWRGCFWGAPGLVLPGRLSFAWWGRSRRSASAPAPAASSGAGEPAADSLQLQWTCQRRSTEYQDEDSSWLDISAISGRVTSSAAGPHRHWADRRCRQSAAAASTPAAPQKSSRLVMPGWRLGVPSVGAPRPTRRKRNPGQLKLFSTLLLSSTRLEKLNSGACGRTLHTDTERMCVVFNCVSFLRPVIWFCSPVVWLSAPNTSC